MKKIRLALIVIIQCVFFFNTATLIFASNIKKELIKTFPSKELFNVTNMAPGQQEVKVFILKNSDNQDISYVVKGRFKDGAEELFNSLTLSIRNGKTVLFNDQLKNFKNLKPRIINSQHLDELTFKIGLPEEIGNEFQQLNCQFELVITAKSNLDSKPIHGNNLPSTGTNILNIIIIGICFLILGIGSIFVKRKPIN